MKMVLVSKYWIYLFFIYLLIFSVSSLFFSVNLFTSNYSIFLEFELFSINSFKVIMLMVVDWLSVSFSSVVMIISSVVFMYSYSYLSDDKSLKRFILLIFLFVASMILMIFSVNMISILLGWDGLGLVSFGLILYYQNSKAYNSSMLTVLSNRLGDVAILMLITWMLNFGNWNVFYLSYIYKNLDLQIILSLGMLAALTKSAQIPFSAWLPAAMAAPTPVSSLVHSSTLVTAGVYLMIRFHEILSLSVIMFYISLMTMILSGVSANFEIDMKKIIALSTLSQLGVMMMILSLGLVNLSYFHLMTHALFKSLLFLCAGVFIHFVGSVQDIRQLGSISIILPVTSMMFFGCNLALCGVPFLSGFYSKDMVLENMMMMEMGNFNYFLMAFAMIMTLTYSFRLLFYMTMLNYKKTVLNSITEDLVMMLPMMILYFYMIIMGSFLGWVYIPVMAIFLPLLMKLKFIVLSLLIPVFVIIINKMKLNMKGSVSLVLNFVSLMWFINANSLFLNKLLMWVGFTLMKFTDQGWTEKMGPQGLINKIKIYASIVDYSNNFDVKMYLFILIYFYMFFMFVLLMMV